MYQEIYVFCGNIMNIGVFVYKIHLAVLRLLTVISQIDFKYNISKVVSLIILVNRYYS